MDSKIPLVATLFAIAPASLQAVTYADYVTALSFRRCKPCASLGE